MSDTGTRLEMARTWGPYAVVITTIALAVIGAVWLNGNMGGKVDEVIEAVNVVRDDVRANGQAIAASNTEIGRLGGLLDEHRRDHVGHERQHEQLTAVPSVAAPPTTKPTKRQ